MPTDHARAAHTVIVSDFHLADAEPPHPYNPLWKRFKRPKLFLDRSFRRFIEHLQSLSPEPIELVLNGDIFDFDSVMVFPRKPSFKVSWLERKRGLFAEEEKSRFKMKVMLDDHAVWVKALRDFVLGGNRLIFIIGNHDMELHWPSVQRDVVDAMELPEEARDRVRFCEWFYVSNGDTLIEHGNQFDEYSMCADPVHPLIRKGSRVFVRLPFGNLANKFLLNGMGLFNPHVESSYIKKDLREYLVFFFKYVARTQPFIFLSWFWGSMVTAIYSIGEGMLPALRDPLMVEARVDVISEKANVSPRVTRSLRALHVHPAYFNPFKIMRELWLDRGILFLLLLGASFWMFSTVNVFVQISAWWFLVPLFLLLPPFVFYARTVESEVYKMQENAERQVPISARIAGVKRVVQGHTHRERHVWVEGVEVLNTGTWSPAYRDVECTQPYGTKCFGWIRPSDSGVREAGIYEWNDPGVSQIPSRTGD
ncbi:MAG: metallophosphoesterase [Bdellovibrionales bacterium]|nr:metallophosphoesterase [Bdellovibrionales bacterium]